MKAATAETAAIIEAQNLRERKTAFNLSKLLSLLLLFIA
jgi:hypothetical protein